MHRLMLLLLLLLCAAGCSLSQQAAQRPAGPAELPAPAELLHQASFTPGVRSLDGAEFEVGLPANHVTPAGTGLVFSPDPLPQALDNYAFATYALDLSGYSGPSLLGLEWDGAAPDSEVWLGLGSFATNRWDWQLVPTSVESDIGPYTDYLSSSGAHMLITILSGHAQVDTLNKVYFGTPGLEPPLNVEATDSADPFKVVITWDPPGGGPVPDGYSIWRSEEHPPSFTSIGTTAGLSYEDETALQDTVYAYAVKSTKSGESDSALSAIDNGVAGYGGIGWTKTIAATVAQTQDPNFISLSVVAGTPAVVYSRNAAGFGIHFVRAQDNPPTSWGSIQDLNASGHETNLGFMNERPVLSYTDGSGATIIKFRHGSLDTGLLWDPPVTVDEIPGAHALTDADLLLIGGVPSLAFRHSDFEFNTGTELCFIRANDALGDDWPALRKVVDSGEDAWNPQLALLLNGYPAIAYGETDQGFADPSLVKFVRATDVTGASWQPPEELATLADANVIPFVQLILANARPAVFYHDPGGAGTEDLYFTRANDDFGADWPSSGVKIAADVDFFDGGATIDGHPAAAYVTDGGTRLMYLEAIDASGTTWYPAELVENNARGLGTATLLPMGSPEKPAIAYRVNRQEPNAGEVKFALKD